MSEKITLEECPDCKRRTLMAHIKVAFGNYGGGIWYEDRLYCPDCGHEYRKEKKKTLVKAR